MPGPPAPPARPLRGLCSELAWHLAAVLATTLLLVVGLRLDQAHFDAPFTYDYDALLILPFVKEVVEGGSHWHTPRLGAPGEQELYDFPVIDHLHLAVVWALGRVFTSPVVVFNAFYLLTYPLTAATTVAVARRFGLSGPAAVTAGVLYAFQPYHYLRGQTHYFLAAYYVVPLAVMLMLDLCLGRLPFFPAAPAGGRRFSLRDRDTVVAGLVALATSAAGAYYAFFTCALVMAAGLYGAVKSRSAAALASAALAALEVAVRGRGAAFAGQKLVRVHRQAHRTARLAPVEAGGDEYLVQPFGLGLFLHQPRAGHDHGLDVGRDRAAFSDLGGGAQVLDAAVGARADEDPVDPGVLDVLPGLKAHIGQGLDRRGALVRVGEAVGRGHDAGHRDHVLGAGAPGDQGRQAGGVDVDVGVEHRVGVGGEGLPVGQRHLPGGALGRGRAAHDVVEGGLVCGHQTGLGPGLDGQVAQGHAAFHRECRDWPPRRIRSHEPVPPLGPDPRRSAARAYVLGGQRPRRGVPVQGNPHVLRFHLAQGLGGQHMFDLRGADALGQGRRRRRGWRCGSRRRRWSCPAGCGPARGRRRGRCRS